MIGKLDPEERVLPESFKQTSDEPYIRHDYKLVYTDGKSKIFDNYSDLIRTWMTTPVDLLDHVITLDHTEPKTKSGGFK